MTVRVAVAGLALVWCAGLARADAPAELAADEAFRSAQQYAAFGDGSALAAYEAIGNARPITRWTDDAWAEAARLAERFGEYGRARHALEQVIAIGADEQLVRRARATLARLSSMTGGGRWDAVAKEHERLVTEIFGGDDPREELTALAALVEKQPDYPRANAIRGALARGWEQEGDRATALRWYRAAAAAGLAESGRRAHLELVRALLRAEDLDAAETEIQTLTRAAAGERVDPAGLRAVEAQLALARQRTWIRRGLWGVIAVLIGVAIVALRRSTGSFAAAAHRLVLPPLEVVFLVPLAGLLILIGYRGNPLVAHAVRDIAFGGVVIAWISGTLLDATRVRHGHVPFHRAVVHAALALLVVGVMAYLALDRDHLLDLVIETWRGGPGLR